MAWTPTFLAALATITIIGQNAPREARLFGGSVGRFGESWGFREPEQALRPELRLAGSSTTSSLSEASGQWT